MTTTDPEALADRVQDGDLRIHELEEHTDADTAAEARRLFVERETGTDLSTTGDYAFPAEQADSAVENMIGAAQIPMGVVGPVDVSGSAANGEHYLPMATTEGALLASVNRGLSVIRSADGADARVTKNGMTRAPVFRVEGVAEAAETVEWVDDNVDALREAAESTTSHGELLAVDTY
ncbi:3-hydroxy-3-methylglutaryl-CoA reductase, partial [Natrialba chahannaoensis JCM 10990]